MKSISIRSIHHKIHPIHPWNKFFFNGLYPIHPLKNMDGSNPSNGSLLTLYFLSNGSLWVIKITLSPNSPLSKSNPIIPESATVASFSFCSPCLLRFFLLPFRIGCRIRVTKYRVWTGRRTNAGGAGRRPFVQVFHFLFS